MALKTLVKVGNISNLSDARYCAGMGVDLLGFSGIKDRPGYIPLKLYQDIRGWVAGPSAVLELYGLKAGDPLEQLLEDYRPDFLEVSMAELGVLPPAVDQSLIVSLNTKDDLSGIRNRKDIQYTLINEDQPDLIQEVSKLFPVILSLRSSAGLSLLNTLPLKGIALSGSPEIRPGFKDYSDLAEVLEQLEVD